jgi:acyl-CoA thioester hydrolase
MLTDTIQFRVRYAETDQMGFVHHSNYAQYFEMGRIEWLRKLGISYKNMEESGILLPVRALNIQFLRPAKYDDELTLVTTLINKPSVKVEFKFEIFNNKKICLTTATVKLAFVNKANGKPIKPPLYFIDKINESDKFN